MQVSHVNQDFSLDNVVPFFQPIMDLSNNTVWRYECLARLVNFNQPAFVPSEFLFLVDRRHSVARLTETIFNRSANYFRNLNVAWSVNASLEDMQDPEIIQFLRAQLYNYPSPQRVSIEVTVNNALENLAVFTEFATFCKSLNIGITLDHFDLHNDDLAQTLALPVDAIKISGNVMQGIEQNGVLHQSLLHLFQQASTRNINLIAEHIEQNSVLEAMKTLGFRYAQGFYLSEPLAKLE
ncbi:EAL domain-containing protein [Paraglaciecola hydrolytica]|uniref:Diguanylate phosphodiesterase n=1 Tax=Paraglaciecola hydrolytica TaxID=1799789 RepID=A0A136A396_9ALTE|nr:EAL domain-containing protein [Paraglaciecola hydrolytica]KXI29702.1 diguanylate phosphodiesterase [Paraglaciecola hydrolytica]